MPKHYKIWLEIEEYDSDSDAYEAAAEPYELACYTTLEEAIELRYTVAQSLHQETTLYADSERLPPG